MNNLFLDTCAGSLGIGIDKNGEVMLSEQAFGKKTAEELFPVLLSDLKKVDLRLNDIEQIFVTRGPGSYTGERLGLTVAKVLATLNHALKVYTCSTLRALAPEQGNCVTLIDARNQAFFAGFYIDGNFLIEEHRADITEIDAYVACHGSQIIIGRFDSKAELTLQSRNFQKRSILEGMMQLSSDHFVFEEDPLTIIPVYMHGQDRK